jgi:hypothetical protein
MPAASYPHNAIYATPPFITNATFSNARIILQRISLDRDEIRKGSQERFSW